jgi:hypothetical protein
MVTCPMVDLDFPQAHTLYFDPDSSHRGDKRAEKLLTLLSRVTH